LVEEHKEEDDGDAESNPANLLAEAFHCRDVCHVRYTNITLFLERFQIFPREDQLLTHTISTSFVLMQTTVRICSSWNRCGWKAVMPSSNKRMGARSWM